MNKGFFALLLLHLLCSSKSFSQEPAIFRGENMVLGKHVAILKDSNNRLNIDAICNLPNFEEAGADVFNLPLSKSPFWLKFSIKNETSEKHLLLSVEYPPLDVCDFYYPVDGTYKVITFSDNLPFSKRTYKHQNYILDVSVPKDSTALFYLKVASSEQMMLPLILGTPQKMAESFLTQQLLWGVLIGLMVVMIFYNLFVFISTKDKSYLYYVMYTAFIGLTQTSLSGYTYHYIFYNLPSLYNLGLVVFPGLAGISAILFITSFLHTKERTPKLHKVFPFMIMLYGSAIVLRIIGFDQISYRMIDISALATTVVTYWAAIKISLQGFRPARLFLLAWSIFFAGLILFILRNSGILPFNNFTSYTMQLGIAFEITLLSLALADKINIFKAEKEKSQNEALKALKENERITREQNVTLELKVNARTIELSNLNHELNGTLVNLKETQLQLVESEKMASLGQLTAGIAHEINNPINFVTSNINPLKRDIDVMFDAFTVIETIGLSDASPVVKRKKVQEYKEELDFEYLTSEIKLLISGIYEGANRTAEIVKGLRIFSRLDEDDLKQADINEGLESTMIIANNLLNRIKIIKEYGKLPLIECFAGKLNQVFLNIISNAAYAVKKRFGETAGGEITLTTSYDEENAFIMIHDNGTGMDAQTQKKVFEPFFTTKEVGEGTGLGMSIAYNTIKKHNGKISISSSTGEGTKLIIQIPLIYNAKIALSYI